MSIFRGDKISVEIYGESHSKKIGVNCTGFPKLKIDLEYLNKIMERRKPSKNAYSTSRKEPDEVIFTFGVNNGAIVDDYFSAEIENKNAKSGDYNNLYGKPRPSHADYTSFTSGYRASFVARSNSMENVTYADCYVNGTPFGFDGSKVKNDGDVVIYGTQLDSINLKSLEYYTGIGFSSELWEIGENGLVLKK